MHLIEKVSRKKYNHLSGVFEAPQQVHSSNIIFYEGLHPFFIKKQRDIFDLKIYRSSIDQTHPNSELVHLELINLDYQLGI